MLDFLLLFTDIVLSNTNIEFTIGSSESCFQISAITDNILENTEQYIFTLQPTFDVNQNDASLTVTIADNDGKSN